MKNRFRTFSKLILLCLNVALFSSAVMPSCDRKDPVLVVQTQPVDHLDSIKPLQANLVDPILYRGSLNLAELPVREKKQKFYDIVLPAVLVAKHNFSELRKRVEAIHRADTSGQSLSETDQLFITKNLKAFKASDTEQLLHKLQLPPTSIIMAQAALESGWGTSRFFTQANNIFGIWSYNRSEPRIRALEGRNGKGVYVRKYTNLSESVEDYLRLLAKAGAYKKFRQLCYQKADPFEAIHGLIYYSELRERYVAKLEVVMEVNELTQFDQYQLNPTAFR